MKKLNSTTWKCDRIKNAELDRIGEPKDDISVIIGDDKQPDFKPQIKLCRWTNEVNFSIRRKDYKPGNTRTEKDKAIWENNEEKIEFYESGDSFKLVWFLKEKPKTNKVEFTIQSKGLDFFYQSELTQKEKDEGASQPENVIGSYAAYHSTKGGMNDISGKDYKVGKAFHIYRPKIIDAEGKEAWGILKVENGIYSVEIQQEFLDVAVYPIKSNDTFGYTDAGGTSLSIAENGPTNYWSARWGSFLNTHFLGAGSGDWTIPSGVTSILVECWGGGGAGGGSRNGGGGGGGAYSRKALTGLTPADTIAYVVGALVEGPRGDESAVDGNITYFLSNDSDGCVAVGGTGGSGGTDGAGGSGGASASCYGDTKYSGGNGASGNDYSGGGGSCAGSAGAGNNASANTAGVAKTERGMAGGKGHGVGVQASGVNGSNAGGGGGGGARWLDSGNPQKGGRGGAGLIRITYKQGITGLLRDIKAYLSGDDNVDVKVFLNKLHGSGTYGSHSQIASKENIDCATAVGWKTFTINEDVLSADDLYFLNCMGNPDDLELDSGDKYNIRYDSVSDNAGRYGSAMQTYAAPDSPFIIAHPTFSYTTNPKFSIYATYSLRFTNPTNIYADDGNYTTFLATSGELSVQVSKDAGVNWQPAITKTFGAGVTTETYGDGDEELWGTSWTRADMVDAKFRVRLIQGNTFQDYKTFGFLTGTNILTGVEIAIKGKYESSTLSLDVLLVKIHYGTSTLPVQAGSQAYASDGRKAGEGAGAGTGVSVFYDGSDWIACDTGATVAA